MPRNVIMYNKISLLIPCHNEEKSIRRCVESCLNQTRKADEIIVVDDGSTDKSLEILKTFGDRIKIVTLPTCSGSKSYAQEAGLKHVTGDVFICTDADTILDKQFIEKIESDFRDQELAAVCGYVKSLKYNWLTACREIDYAVTQNFHKLAQSYINFLLVIPGCAAAFKTVVFKKHISFDHDTVTEDLDFTYKLNQQDLKIKYNKQAIAYTQDPTDLRSYINQMTRWYSGGWQNLLKHLRIVSKPASALELTLVYVEGLAFALLLLLLPLLSIKYFTQFILFYLIIALLLSTYAAFINKRMDLILYSPLYLLIVLINAWIFIKEFFILFILKRKNLIWHKVIKREIT